MDTTGTTATESRVWSEEEDGGSSEERDGGRRTTETSDARSSGGGEREGREEEVGRALRLNDIKCISKHWWHWGLSQGSNLWPGLGIEPMTYHAAVQRTLPVDHSGSATVII